MIDPSRTLALGFSPESRSVLERLQQGGTCGDLLWPGSDIEIRSWLEERWQGCQAVVAVGACGLVVRLIAPLLRDKDNDPAVVVIDALGRHAIPLLGGHRAGAEDLAQRLAALLGGEAICTGTSRALGRLPHDSFGEAWGWRRGAGDWSALMVAAARSEGRVTWLQECGSSLWRDSVSGPGPQASAAEAELRISHRIGPGCRWHPPCLWLGIGCERDSSAGLLERLVNDSLAASGLAPEAVAGVASVDRKGDEPALLELAERHGWPLRLYEASRLAGVAVPNPSQTVASVMGTASVSEAAALLAAGEGATLLVEKTIASARVGERGAATLAVALAPRQWAPERGELHLVGSGPGSLDLLSGDARAALARATAWLGYGPYLDLLEPLRRPDQIRREGRLTEEQARCAEALDLACQGLRVALISSGDSGIYGMAGLALELWLGLPAGDRPRFQVHPGISALQLAAARLGAPLMHDFCTISLSDRLTPWELIERRLRAAAAGDFVVALYNPRSRGRDWQLERARQVLLEHRSGMTPVGLARQLGRPGESLQRHTLADLPVEQVDMLTVVLIGNSSTRLQEEWMLTPRGYLLDGSGASGPLLDSTPSSPADRGHQAP